METKFSLIMATYNRFNEIEDFLVSLRKQKYKIFELIIIDQNDKIDLLPLVIKYQQDITILYHKNAIKGLSLNRNIGLNMASGDIICFPDDDCFYTEYTLNDVKEFYENNKNIHFLTITSKDFSDKFYKNDISKKIRINSANFFNKSISYSIFIKKEAIKDFMFDTDFGIGAYYGSGEDTDLILYALRYAYKGFYLPCVYIYHPKKKNELNIDRISKYVKGFGALMKKGIIVYNNYYCLILFIKYVVHDLIKILIKRNKSLYISSLSSRIQGFRTYGKSI